MPSIHDYINADTTQNKDLNSFLKNPPQELADDPVDLYETTIKIEVDKARSAGQTLGYKESFLAIEIDIEKCLRDSEGLVRLFVGYVVHPGDSGFDIKDLISIPRSYDNKARWDRALINRFYITGPDKDGTFPANKGVVDVRPTPPDIEEPTEEQSKEEVMHQEPNDLAGSLDNMTSNNSTTFQYGGDLLKDVEKFTNDGMRCIRENPEFFLKNFTWLVKRTKLNAKIKVYAVHKDHRKRFYQALNMFKSGSMTSLKRKRAAADHYKLDYKNFSSVVASANSLGLMNRNVKI